MQSFLKEGGSEVDPTQNYPPSGRPFGSRLHLPDFVQGAVLALVTEGRERRRKKIKKTAQSTLEIKSA